MKNNKINKIIALFLVLITCFSVCVGCASESGGPGTDSGKIVESEYSLVANGNSNYVIVTKQSPTDLETDAAELIQKYFEEATSIKLPIYSESGVVLTETSSLIIIGRTQMLADSGITVDDALLGPSGFMIKRKDSNVFLCGSQDLGTLFSAQEFLNLQFNYEVYQSSVNESESCYSLETGVTDKKLLDLDYTDRPTFDYRQKFGQYYSKAEDIGYGLRFTGSYDAFVLETPDRSSSWPWHNSFRVIDPDVYNNPDKPETYHPKWFVKPDTREKNQISVTANGDAEELALLQQEIINKLTYAIELDFSKGNYSELISFMQEDNGTWQEGESMAYFEENYGTAACAASLIYFINPIAKKIGEYMEENHPGREMNVVVFAYWTTLEAPVVLTDNGYEPMSENVVLEDNVSILYAPIRAKHNLSYESAEENARFLDIMNKWASLTKHMNFWIYNVYFHQYFMFYDTFNVIQENLQLLAKYNPSWLFCEGGSNSQTSGFRVLKEYVTAKLMWDVNEDVVELTNNFFDNYYKNASGVMKDLYYEMRSYFGYLRDYKGLDGEIMLDGTDDIKLWPQKTIEYFSSFIDKAYEALEPLKESDPMLYNTIRNRIKIEGLLFRYLKLKNYPSAWPSVDSYNDAINELQTDCNLFGVQKFLTSQTMESALNQLRK